MTKWTKVLALSALALICASGVLAQGESPTARVAVIQIPNPTVDNPDPNKPADWLYKVRPGTVILDRNAKILFITNYTNLEMTVALPEGFPAAGPPTSAAEVADSKRKRSIIKFKDLRADKIDGAFTYHVSLKDAAGNTYTAHGESEPHVIIDP